jgi:hypothetical protein
MNWESLLVQAPLAAAVIWFVLEMDRRNARYAARRDDEWRKFLEDQRQAFTASLTQISQSVRDLEQAFNGHDRAMQKTLVRLEARAKTQKRGGNA